MRRRIGFGEWASESRLKPSGPVAGDRASFSCRSSERVENWSRLKAKVGEITMANELLCAKIDSKRCERPILLRSSVI